ncbi:unnamed protein product [Lactuca virosa]|uniref:Uncharacterized protein n=1 Tax=Lactuca virosa TaxID=75947 RepID=A0AAU9P2K9_9ASTR|nr:unnamed protein product [Lactuca virosa]
MQLSENSQPIRIEYTPIQDSSTTMFIKSGVISHNTERIYFCTKNGLLLEFTEADPPRLSKSLYVGCRTKLPITCSTKCQLVCIIKGHMVLCFPSTPNKLWMTVGLFLGGSSLFGVGLYLSYVHIAPQQARIKARNDYVRDRLKKKYGYDKFTTQPNKD